LAAAGAGGIGTAIRRVLATHDARVAIRYLERDATPPTCPTCRTDPQILCVK
jgi:hypothetical protein